MLAEWASEILSLSLSLKCSDVEHCHECTAMSFLCLPLPSGVPDSAVCAVT